MPGRTYIVKAGDTLSTIASRYGTSVNKLVRINHLPDPDKLQVGQHLRLADTTVRCVKPLFLDAAYNPLKGLQYRMECGTAVVHGTSGSNGEGTAHLITTLADTVVGIWAKIAWHGDTWEKIAEVMAEPGEKLVTLVSPMLRVKAPVVEHPKDKNGKPLQEQKPEARTATPRGTPAKAEGDPVSTIVPDGPGLKVALRKDGKGITRAVLSEDLPDLAEYFAAYTGESITEDDWENAADNVIHCDVNVLKAIPEVETSGGPGFFANSGIPPLPKILYERHIFARETNHLFDTSNAYLSSSTPGAYASGTGNYYKFAKAYLLNSDAAIDACSWGKFQIMGFNFKEAGYYDRSHFLKAAFTSEKTQFNMFIDFVINYRKGSLKRAVITKDWVKIAQLYNGINEAKTPKWWKRKHSHWDDPSRYPKDRWVPYHEKLANAYRRLINHD